MQVKPFAYSTTPFSYGPGITDASVASLVGSKPTIVRDNVRKDRGYSITLSPKGKFIVVNEGRRVSYYGNPFHNVYRIASDSFGDWVTHRAK